MRWDRVENHRPVAYLHRVRKAQTAIACASLLICLTSCASDLAEFLDRKEVWRTQGPEDYTWTLEASEPVFGPRRVQIRVRDSLPVNVQGDVSNDTPTTVEELIDHLVRSADANSITVRWSDLGYPSSIRIDHGDAIDDEVSYRVLSFHVDQSFDVD
jgi:hypothetical protein